MVNAFALLLSVLFIGSIAWFGPDKVSKYGQEILDGFIQVIGALFDELREAISSSPKKNTEGVEAKKQKALYLTVFKSDFPNSDSEWHELLWVLSDAQYVWPYANEMFVRLVDNSSECIQIVLKNTKVVGQNDEIDLVRCLYEDLEAYGFRIADIEHSDVYIEVLPGNGFFPIK